MLIAIIGESCVGKSTLAEKLKERLGAEVYTGKDYLRLAKNETLAKALFRKRLEEALTGDHILYVVSEKEHLDLIPAGAVRVLMTADLDVIVERFTARMRGTLPPPVKTMLERRHGCFDAARHDVHIHSGDDLDAACDKICAMIE